MNRSKSCVFIFRLALLFAVAMPSAVMADGWDKATKLTFSEPVEVPGLVLTAGTYWFTLADSDSDRNIVQIWDADRMHLVTTILAIPNYRLQPTGKTASAVFPACTGPGTLSCSWDKSAPRHGVQPSTLQTLLSPTECEETPSFDLESGLHLLAE